MTDDPLKAVARMVVADVYALLQDRVLGPCVRCGVPVALDLGGWPSHVGNDGGFWRGCRAASYIPQKGWNYDIPRSWQAKAPKTGAHS